MSSEKKSGNSVKVSIGGGVSGKVNVAGGDLNITETSSDAAALERLFAMMLQKLDSLPGVDKQVVADAKEPVQAIQAEASKGEQADESVVSKHLRSIARMGPEILDVVTASLVNPAAGIALVIQKIAKKAREEAGLS